MKIGEREFLLHRIVNSYLKYSKDGVRLKIHCPTKELLYDASDVYRRFYELSLNEGIMTDFDTLDLLTKFYDWNDEKQKQLDTILPKHVEYWKEELFKAYYHSGRQKTIRQYLSIAKDELNRLFDTRHKFDHATCSGVANYAKMQFIVEKSTYKGNKRYNWSNISPYIMMLYYQDNIIKDEDIRLIAHTQPWDMTWSIGKKIGNVFGKAAIDLSVDQLRLCMWSSIYDNVSDQPEPPPQDVIDDDDMLDGWLSLRRKDKTNNSTNLTNNEKINNAAEVYVPAGSIEDAQKIEQLNSQYAKTIKKQRFAAIDKHGQLTEANLPDVKQDLIMKMAQKTKGN